MMSELILRSLGKGTVIRRLFASLWLFLALSGARDVFAIPVISTNPVSVFASTGQTVTFAVAVSQMSNTPPLFVQWRRTGANIPGALTTFSNVPGTAFLIISNAQAADAGSYHATVFDADAAVDTTNVNLFITNLSVLPVGNSFTNRGSITGSSGAGTADNFSSTNEPGTPRNNNIPGGAMVWLKWPVTFYPGGVATVDTRGSDFDTTVGIYQISTNNNSAQSVTNLVATIGSDDEGGYFNSSVSFNVTFGSEYEIGIDGYYGSRGHIVLNWSIQGGGQIPPITQQPQSQTTLSNSTVFLSVAVDTNTDFSTVLYQWYFDGTPITNATQSSLTITNVFSTVGLYQVRVQFSDQASNFAAMSQAANIQINSQGNTHAAAQFKFQQAADPNSYPGGPIPLILAPVVGFTGTQTFPTFSSMEQPGEPNHCGKVGGSPAWYSCVATNNGTITADAYTPTYTNVLAVYTNSGGTDFSTLVPVACSSSNSGVGHEVTSFPATKGITNYVVVDGLNRGYGNCSLTLSFVAPPTIITNPQSQTVQQGTSAALTVSAIGMPSPALQWRTNKVKYGGRTATLLTVPNFQAVNQGDYDVVVTNLAGSVTSSLATLYLDSPLRFTNYERMTTNSFNFLLLGKVGTNYIIQATTNLATTNWIPIYTNLATYGLTFYADTNMRSDTNRFFRATIKTN